ncbi:MAG TPA: hypothetical protein VJR71_15515 [Pseudolabrys sp.]|nr:hypothetical protein [Pseudolabrys sp.]
MNKSGAPVGSRADWSAMIVRPARMRRRHHAAKSGRLARAAKKARVAVNQVLKVFTSFGRISKGFIGNSMLPVRGRFCGAAANASVRQVVSFAPTSASGRTNEVFAAIP